MCLYGCLSIREEAQYHDPKLDHLQAKGVGGPGRCERPAGTVKDVA